MYLKNLVAVGVSAVLWSIWKIRNNAGFQDKFSNDPVEIRGAEQENLKMEQDYSNKWQWKFMM
uniref:Uncharacterized protein n=1 Tax=Oryza brachyantha TaxID=4533 RepID=J3LTC0_ORYBR